MENLQIRPAEAKDALQIANVHVGTWQFAYRGQMPDSLLNSLSTESRTTFWQEVLSSPNNPGTVWVAEENKKVVGFCSAGASRDTDRKPETGEIYAIYVDPNHMGRGIGSRLLDQGVEALKQQGFKDATLWVLDTNEKTRRFYESKGWKVDGATKTERQDGFEVHEVRYRLTQLF
jgi:ribosomal protein S18 acetylase RimI-like enzyme